LIVSTKVFGAGRQIILNGLVITYIENVAENTLQQIVDQISSVANSAVGCALGDKRDCVELAFRLANARAEQQAKFREWNEKPGDRIFQHDSFRNQVDLDEIDVQRIRSAMDANGC